MPERSSCRIDKLQHKCHIVDRFFKTPDGVKIQELALGSGSRVAKAGDQVVLDYVLRLATDLQDTSIDMSMVSPRRQRWQEGLMRLMKVLMLCQASQWILHLRNC